MTSKSYKSCGVPLCKNTTIKTPDKLFICVPKNKERKKWLQLARRNPAGLTIKSTIYFCEDHFDLPNAMDNYMQYHLMGSVSQIRMKPGCLPTNFSCQPDRRKRMSKTSGRPSEYIRRKLKRETIEECEKEYKCDVTSVTVEIEFDKSALESSDLPNPEDQQVTLKNTAKSNQVQKRRKSLFKEDSLVNSKTSSHRLREQAPGPSGSSVETTLPYPGDLGSNIQLIDPLAEPEPRIPQCRFCGEVTEDCIDVTEDKPYLTRNKTTLILNNLSVELDFEDAPTTVCQTCDSKLIAMFDFVTQVKAAQEYMNSVTVKEEVDVEVKTECESPTPDNNDEILIESNVEDVYSENDTVDSLQVTETIVKPATKRKIKQVLVPKQHKKHKIIEDIDRPEKPKVIEDVDRPEKPKVIEDVDRPEKPKVIEDVDRPEKPKVIKDVDRLEIKESDWIVDIKEETVEREDEHEVEYLEFSGTETDHNISNPSESELDTILKLMK